MFGLVVNMCFNFFLVCFDLFVIIIIFVWSEYFMLILLLWWNEIYELFVVVLISVFSIV